MQGEIELRHVHLQEAPMNSLPVVAYIHAEAVAPELQPLLSPYFGGTEEASGIEIFGWSRCSREKTSGRGLGKICWDHEEASEGVFEVFVR